MPIPTREKAELIDQTIAAVANMGRPTQAPKRRQVRGGSSAAGIFILKITSSSSISAYVADIIDNRTDQTIITEDVTLQALDHSDGTIPNGNMITCSYDKINDIYEPVGYNYAYGT